MQNSLKKDAAIIEALRSKGYKATPQRIAVCKIALSSREHPSAQKIYQAVKKTHPTVSLATVYSTLNILEESCLIQELKFPQGHARYDPNLQPHINLVCLECGKIQDVDDAAAKEFVQKINQKANFTPVTQRIDVYGACERCSKR